MKYTMLYLLIGIIAGASVPTQAGINAKLNIYTGSPVIASIISFLAGSATLIIYGLVTRTPLPPMTAFTGAPWWIWIGGCLGAFYVASCIVIANKVGALSLVALILAGQMIASLILDHFGLIGYKVQPISFLKIAGILLIVAGIYCIRIG